MNAREFLSRQAGPNSPIEDQVRALVLMLSSPAGLALRYEWASTAHADATIENGGGSCLSLSAVLIALARGLGIKAYYVDASRTASETKKEGQLTVHSGHIAVMLEFGRTQAIVDFAGEIDQTFRTRRVDDTEIVAHYYNNRGYEIIHTAHRNNEPVPWREVLGQFRIATRVSPRFALAWNNAGLALARLGREEEANLAIRHALALDENLLAARRNLRAWQSQASNESAEALPQHTGGLKWKRAADGSAALRWRVTPQLKLGLKSEVPEAAVEAVR